MFTIDAENIVYRTLISKIDKGSSNINTVKVSIENLKQFTELAQAKMVDYHFDISENAICAAVEINSNVFRWDNDQITFTDFYKKEPSLFNRMFFRRLPNKVSRELSEISF